MGVRQARSGGSAPWRGTAFLVEACVLLAFVVAAVAVFAALFLGAAREGERAVRLTRAVVAARDAAERFVADGEDGSWEAGELRVRVDVTEDDEVAGLLRATVSVTDAGGELVYQLTTARAAGGDES